MNKIHEISSKQTKILSIVDSGIFMDYHSIYFKNEFGVQLRNLYKVANIDSSTPNSQCNAYYPTDQWKCLLLEYSFSSLGGKKLFINS